MLLETLPERITSANDAKIFKTEFNLIKKSALETCFTAWIHCSTLKVCTLSSNSNFGANANPLAIQVSKRKFEVNNGAIDGAYRKATGQLKTFPSYSGRPPAA